VLMSFDWQQDHTARVESSRDDDSYTFMKEGSSSSSSSSASYADRGGVSSFTSMQRAEQFNSDRNRMKKFEWKKDDVAKAHEASGVNSILFTACGRFLVSSGNDRRVRLWSTNNGYLHSINYDVSCTSSLPFAMELISDFSSGADDVLAHPSGDQGDIALVALHSSSGTPFKHLKGHLGAVTCIAYRQGHGQLITAAKDGMVYLWDCSAAQKERESRADDDRHSNKGRRDAGAVVSRNDDSWSDGGGISDEEQRATPRYFVPPIVQRYLEDAAESKRQHQQEQQRILAARATARMPSSHRSGVRVQATGQGEGGGGVSGVGGMHDSTSSTLYGTSSSSGSSSRYLDPHASSSWGQERAHAPASARTGMRVKYQEKAKDSHKDKSVRERAELLFALNAVSALRSTATSSSSSTSSSTTSSAVAPNTHVLGSASSDSSYPTQQRNGGASAINGIHEKATLTLCQREKEREDKEKEKKQGKGKKEKSKLTSLREKFSATSKKPRR
jgi:WD40 repeat protein